MRRSRFAVFVLVLLAAPLALAVSVGEPAPSIALPDADGRTIELAKLRGRVVYVDFWASWCGPCKRSFPWMNEMADKYGASGLTIVAINLDKKREDAQRFLQLAPARFAIAYDPAGTTPVAFAVKAMPSSYLVDAAGKIALVESGFRDERKGEVEERIRAALATRQSQ
jgi:thiol-disulfide isomerase/thioredoxin